MNLRDGGPLCPRVTGPIVDPMHALSVAHHDAAFEAAPKDSDGEIADAPADRVVTAVGATWGTSNRMRLFRCESDVYMAGPRIVTVEAWYYQCGVCGLILPATRHPM